MLRSLKPTNTSHNSPFTPDPTKRDKLESGCVDFYARYAGNCVLRVFEEVDHTSAIA